MNKSRYTPYHNTAMLTFYSPSLTYDTDENHIIYLVHLYGKQGKDLNKKPPKVKPKRNRNR